MDGFNEKKWFIYVVDHHEGPFSMADLGAKLKDGTTTPGSYIWSEGMADWKQILELPAFHSMVSPGGGPGIPDAPAKTFALDLTPVIGTGGVTATSAITNGGQRTATTKTTGEKVTSGLLRRGTDMLKNALTGSTSTKKKAEVTGASSSGISLVGYKVPQAAQPFQASRGATASFPSGRMAPAQTPHQNKKSSRPAITVGILLILGLAYWQGLFDSVLKSNGVSAISDFSLPALTKVAEIIPYLGDIITPFAKPEGVTPEDYEELKTNARGRELSDGPKSTFVAGAAESGNPVIYASTNLSDGTPFRVHVEGAPDSLLNMMEFKLDLDITVNHRIGQSTPLTLARKQPIPRGQYTVTMTSALTKPVKKILFLGGPRDAQYTARLKEYHDRLRARAEGELMELRQFKTLLDSRYAQATFRLNAVRKAKKGPVQAKLWAEFEQSWQKMGAQLQATFSKWTPQVLATEYFYGKLYEALAVAGQTLDRFHQVQENYFKPGANPKLVDIQLSEAGASVQNALQVLKAKIDEASKMPPTPNGMPRREGL